MRGYLSSLRVGVGGKGLAGPPARPEKESMLLYQKNRQCRLARPRAAHDAAATCGPGGLDGLSPPLATACRERRRGIVHSAACDASARLLIT